MSDVYVADDRLLGRTVVVKLLSEGRRHEQGARERMEREARVGARLGEHPHIVTVHDAGSWRGRPFIVMEFAANGSIAERIEREGRPSVSQAIRWLQQTAEALDAAHERGVVHRDLKPANLLLDQDDGVRIADFGVAWEAGEPPLTCEGEVLGTAGYLAPEQAAGQPVTAQADIYALAVVAHELLTGALPNSPDAERLAPDVEDILIGALASDPARRPTSAGELTADLVAALAPTSETTRRLIAGRSHYPARRRRSVWRRRLTLALVAVAASIAGVIAGALVGFDVAAGGSPLASGPPPRCALSTLDNDANVVVQGAKALSFCRSQARALSLGSDPWGFRSGRRLIAPNTNDPTRLSGVCTLQGRGLSLHVYDDATQRIGHDVCRQFALAGWEVTNLS